MTLGEAREQMVSVQLAARGIRDERVLEAMRDVPRHLFVPEELRDEAYEDRPLPIGESQTISQPYMVAAMSEALGVKPGERVLEIGTGSGYQAAILAHMGAQVFSVERIHVLASSAKRHLANLGYDSCHVHCGDGNDGWPEEAPYDAALVTAATREVPRAILRQLRLGGRMVLPIGTEEIQELVRLWRKEQEVKEEYLGGCRFVRLIGRHGWEA